MLTSFVSTSSSCSKRDAMKSDEAGCESRDILSDRLTTGIVYWLPIVALIVSGSLGVATGWRALIWVVALTTMGVGCLVNAFRCRRVHCYLTGPFFLIIALTTALYGLGVVKLGERGWTMISLILLAGGLLLYYVPEAIVGRYRRSGR